MTRAQPRSKKSAPIQTGALRGHIDAIHIAPDFLEISGWVCRLDNKAADPPLTLTINKQTFSGYDVRFRPDLATAGIADGVAAFNLVFPSGDFSLSSKFEVSVSDASGLACTLLCPQWRVKQFTPRGMIDEVGEHFVCGWVFDPSAAYASQTPMLMLDSEVLCNFSATIERQDLLYDAGNSARQFGFEIQTSLLREVIKARGERFDGRTAVLTLVSSGLLLAEAPVSVLDGSMRPLDAAKLVTKRTPIPRSDMLMRLATQVKQAASPR
jgi:hypothetical protein